MPLTWTAVRPPARTVVHAGRMWDGVRREIRRDVDIVVEDGPRIYYNFMRPTFTDAQLKLELERAKSLEYDLVKCYVRLPVMWHKRVIAFAHGVGIPATSHYHYPAMAFGGDGMEHTGATNRFGYSRTVTPLGTGYSDVTDLFVASDMARTPTLFGSTTLYREDKSLVEDRRVRTLNPPWRLAALQESADAASRTDQTARRENLRAQVRQALGIYRRGGRIADALGPARGPACADGR
ncbi:IS110 family transposase [Streptomyces olivaceus]|uniref:IS110 family transposase n=1 Tax=Streptomyces olivaceus TaxID=47716 RepID=UPI001CCB24B2|nr:IS110 family transposase [Streptomyces olivaceus]MBZ6296062.1 IS110 family transposase [Streptomyces olivaceus]MBZ6331010.1 IS110 family transposase [Streptomyces olivaceus]